MENTNQSKAIIKQVIDQEQINKAKDILVNIRNITRKFISSKKHDKTIIIVAVVIFFVAIYRVF